MYGYLVLIDDMESPIEDIQFTPEQIGKWVKLSRTIKCYRSLADANTELSTLAYLNTHEIGVYKLELKEYRIPSPHSYCLITDCIKIITKLPLSSILKSPYIEEDTKKYLKICRGLEKDLDILINDPDVEIRDAIADTTDNERYLDLLVKDSSEAVRCTIAKRRKMKYLDLLIENDSSESVREYARVIKENLL